MDDDVPRAHRFQIAAPVFWRQQDDAVWSEAVSINASRSGILFRTGRLLEVGTEIELIFGLSWDGPEWAHLTDVICGGQIVRAGETDIGAAVAVTIDRYSFLRER